MTRPAFLFSGLLCLALFLVLFLAPVNAQQDPIIGHSGLPVPRFVNLKEAKTWGRVGPAQTYPVRFDLTRQYLPVQIIAETRDNVWRKVKDVDGETMWIHHSKLTSSGHVMVARTTGIMLRTKPDIEARPRANLQYGVLASLENCAPRWCQITTNGFRGWVPLNALWGVTP